MDWLTPHLLDGAGAVTVAVVGASWFVRSLSIGKLCTGRELREKNTRIAALEAALATRDDQVNAALGVLPEVTKLLQASATQQEGS